MLSRHEAQLAIKQLPGHAVAMLYLNEIQILNILTIPLVGSYTGVGLQRILTHIDFDATATPGELAFMKISVLAILLQQYQNNLPGWVQLLSSRGSSLPLSG